MLTRRELLRGAIAGALLSALPAQAQPTPACPIVNARRSVVVQRGNRERAEFCLTYDDCWDDALTYRIGEALAQRGLSATFFPAGVAIRANLDRPTKGYERLYPRLLEMGHEFACHTYSHPDITDMSARRLKNYEIASWQAVLEEALGAPYESVAFRPPLGIITDALYRVSVELQTPVVLWSTDMQDHLCGRDIDACLPALEARFERTLSNGALYLHHCTEGALAVLPAQVALAEAMNMRHVTLSEMLANLCA